MNKLAMFVEGYTEQEFATRMIQEIARVNSVAIQWRKIIGGTTCRRRSRLIRSHSADNQHQHFIVIYDCGGDAAVKTRMREEYDNLAGAGYSKIICVRDVYPEFSHADIPRLEQGLPYLVKTKPIVVSFVLSVMEIEAWFLAEHHHFAAIDPAITIEAIVHSLHFDPSVDDMRQRPTPAQDLKACYTIAGKTYNKNMAKAKRTVDALDVANVYCHLVDRFPYLKVFCDELTAFLDGRDA